MYRIRSSELVTYYTDISVLHPRDPFFSTYKMATDPETISNFLSEQRESAPEDLQQSFLTIEDFWDRKLWHQLTGVLVDYFHNPDSASQRLPLFRHFILSFSEKINQLKFVYLGLLAATQCAGSFFPIYLPLNICQWNNGLTSKQIIKNVSPSSPPSQKR